MADKNNVAPVRITEMFAEGKRFTEEVMQENARLRAVVAGQRSAIAELRTTQDEEMPRLKERVGLMEDENRLLREELTEIKKQYGTIEQENWDFSERYLHVERQNNSLLNLYVAAQRLHSTLMFREVLQVVQELVVNLVGSESFEICMYDRQRLRLVVLASVGTRATAGGEVALAGSVATAMETGAVQIMEPPALEVDGEPLIACIPLQLGDHVLGAILIRELLSQKNGFEGIDHELFELLGERAAAAVCASHLYSKSRLAEDAEGWSTLIDEMATAAVALEGSDVEPMVIW